MGWLIGVAVLALPVMEIMAWIRAAEVIGAWSVIGLTVAAVLLGTAILRNLGLAVLLNARARLQQGEVPLQAAFDGLFLAASGVLLILPGFISDALGLLLLLPPVRRLIREQMALRLVVMPGASTGPASGPVTIDGDYTVVEPEPPPADTKHLEP
ncbi:hypothetical protein A6A04_02810 [Paramagnetospirillum marisnigri]|uniref:FxsA protein n=1 Tax=Paramagnetospirillum marisnigri TaxID=1285242 RepID=A0A178MNI2_9PROT|nr:FxsA family protein [Paramagnetospirillum marisnigri]OAN50342.1 hypothetical protein A6A04_02810 [Paramagnetospirillum marisnigri]